MCLIVNHTLLIHNCPMNLRQTPSYANFMENTGWKIEHLHNLSFFRKRILFLGNFIKLQRPEILNLSDIKTIITKFRLLYFLVEPKNQKQHQTLINLGFSPTQPFIPSRTITIDLTPSQKEIYQKFKKDCRYSIRKSASLAVKKTRQLSSFRTTWKKAVGLKRYIPSLSDLIQLKKAFGSQSLFLFNQELGAGAIFLVADNTCYYWYAFTAQKGRQKLIQYQIIWQGMLWAKKKKCKTFDFEGIYDKRFPNKSWLGFTHFKRSFNGKEVEYPQSVRRINIFWWVKQ